MQDGKTAPKPGVENLNFRHEIEDFAHKCWSLMQFAIFPVLPARFFSAWERVRACCSFVKLVAFACRPKSTPVPLPTKVFPHGNVVKRARKRKPVPLRCLKHH
ncbi:hypothetical protein [Massilia sp. CCM 8734]|uniref:hypothetical protein n=1 Tax=Massilia sp. CCM 8734 TaxID=2609283 RepID=UPI0014243D5E|nr:hypothetical protein [Massilia sp. CCM 8734]NHZ96663.1 hypothetical protein [Massilia sp. CCM 8734]